VQKPIGIWLTISSAGAAERNGRLDDVLKSLPDGVKREVKGEEVEARRK
jgi:hypothetical protein